MDTHHPTPPDSNPPTDNNHHPNPNSNPNNNNRDQFLRHLTHLNKLSHKITKPNTTNRHSEPPVHPPPVQQPPVYNISKSDFRDVVQKLTGSPAHAHPNPHSQPHPHAPSLHAPTPKPNSARLQRIRPPPLAPLTSVSTSGFGSGSGLGQMSPLPPLPTCHGAAESPISAYMRFFHSAVGNSTGINFSAPENIENLPPMFASVSPSSPCSLSSPKLILPLSPTVPGVASPK